MLRAHRSFTRSPFGHGQRRGYLADSFLELATALPFPAGWPAYSSTIIATTVAARLAILPISLWANQRMIRNETRVMPELRAARPQIWHEGLAAMRKEKFEGDKDAWRAELAKRSEGPVRALMKTLARKHHATRMPTVLVPALAQLAMFVPATYFLTRVAASPFSMFDAESFLSLASLAHPDETLVLPIALGLITFANAEASTWFMSSRERDDEMKRKEKRVADAANGVRTLSPGAISRTLMRGLSVFRILIATQVSGAVCLYWVVSAAFGLVQTWYMEWRRLVAIRALPPPPDLKKLSLASNPNIIRQEQPKKARK
ncbi:hypothetical protein CYLTODRAFT_364300 [Cylindrobasidium torrendii FP15055 ss-10]|uniref:Uncharacterized protein n=1 Tax=Cylindrobasidium torrendii FP15055 ss-10 TaxID=1314674 RepID=A0A0D7BUD1_9AGAR|nr:hypothetical protein CYLTODRAFT_364300 [Cylindrobasidium torrendii FP15055 ss-10]